MKYTIFQNNCTMLYVASTTLKQMWTLWNSCIRARQAWVFHDLDAFHVHEEFVMLKRVRTYLRVTLFW